VAEVVEVVVVGADVGVVCVEASFLTVPLVIGVAAFVEPVPLSADVLSVDCGAGVGAVVVGAESSGVVTCFLSTPGASSADP
jgi:hypothetical protein